MGFGLQCWDENGNLVVDTSDYNCRYIGTYNVKMNGRWLCLLKAFLVSTQETPLLLLLQVLGVPGLTRLYCAVATMHLPYFAVWIRHVQTFTVEVYRYA
jgi:hypothetical protein